MLFIISCSLQLGQFNSNPNTILMNFLGLARKAFQVHEGNSNIFPIHTIKVTLIDLLYKFWHHHLKMILSLVAVLVDADDQLFDASWPVVNEVSPTIYEFLYDGASYTAGSFQPDQGQKKCSENMRKCSKISSLFQCL